MSPETTHVATRRLLLAGFAVLHFVAAPCVMAMSAAAEEPCGHCGAGEVGPCLAPAADPAGMDGAPAPGRARPPAAPDVPALLLPPAGPGAGSLHSVLELASPASRAELVTGRHTGDPPLTLLHGRFLN